MMEDKDVVLLLAVVMVFFATLFISKQQALASSSVPTISTSFNIEATSQIVDDEAAKSKAEAEVEHQKLLVAKQIKMDEDLKIKQQLVDLEKKIKAFVGDDIDKFGMVYYDIKSKKSIEINVDNLFLAASTVKVPINMLVYDMIQDKKIDINEELKYRKLDFEGGAGRLQETDLSKPIPIKELSDYSIRYSDNIAINMLLRKVGNKNRHAYIEKITGHPLVLKGNYTTPMDSFKILERLYLNPDNNEYYSGLVENMKKTEYHDRIDKYIPNEIVAHKIGNYAGYVNDMAIVYDEEPYILAVFTKNMPEAAKNIAQVSKIIYEDLQ
ncbi:serine hydrolase [Clostridium sp.]|jgi:beta-lactamase class A|uniref:serine hydrolase n=1 Tax=Clostridium sp. TaxID=1506 RepID=UPI003EE985C9